MFRFLHSIQSGIYYLTIKEGEIEADTLCGLIDSMNYIRKEGEEK
jgi:hypothetical protein